MRAFFALDICTQDRLAIHRWREKAWVKRSSGLQITADNLHITLAFLGQVSLSRLEPLITEAEQLAFAPMSLCCDYVGYWSKPRVLWLGVEAPAPLMSLATQLQRIGRQAGCKIERRPYRPHITLQRKLTSEPPAPLIPPKFHLTIQSFSLYESKSGIKGPTYRPLATFSSSRNAR